MMNIFNYVVQSGLLVAILGLAASAITYGKKLIDARSREVTSEIKDTNIRNAVDTVENAATTVVYELSQTVVDDLKEKAADGKLTPDEIAQLKADSLAKVKQLIGTEVLATIQTVFGDAEAWVTSKIEAAVKDLKLNTPLTIVGEAISAPSVSAPADSASSGSTPAASDRTPAPVPTATPAISQSAEAAAAPANSAPATATSGQTA